MEFILQIQQLWPCPSSGWLRPDIPRNEGWIPHSVHLKRTSLQHMAHLRALPNQFVWLRLVPDPRRNPKPLPNPHRSRRVISGPSPSRRPTGTPSLAKPHLTSKPETPEGNAKELSHLLPNVFFPPFPFPADLNPIFQPCAALKHNQRKKGLKGKAAFSKVILKTVFRDG